MVRVEILGFDTAEGLLVEILPDSRARVPLARFYIAESYRRQTASIQYEVAEEFRARTVLALRDHAVAMDLRVSSRHGRQWIELAETNLRTGQLLRASACGNLLYYRPQQPRS